jgi:Flp pilus assembly protein TadD
LGEKLEREGLLKEATEEYRKAIALDPDDAQTYRKLPASPARLA